MPETITSRGIGGHHRAHRGATDEWLTPPEIIEALGVFDLDPCSPVERPWDTAKKHYTIHDNGLWKPWSGRVWLNPPYGPQTSQWLEKLAKHGHGTALIFARTETVFFHEWVWPMASAVLFLRGRLHFYNVRGEQSKMNAGGPSVLVAYGEHDAALLRYSGIPGAYIELKGACDA